MIYLNLEDMKNLTRAVGWVKEIGPSATIGYITIDINVKNR